MLKIIFNRIFSDIYLYLIILIHLFSHNIYFKKYFGYLFKNMSSFKLKKKIYIYIQRFLNFSYI